MNETNRPDEIYTFDAETAAAATKSGADLERRTEAKAEERKKKLDSLPKPFADVVKSLDKAKADLQVYKNRKPESLDDEDKEVMAELEKTVSSLEEQRENILTDTKNLVEGIKGTKVHDQMRTDLINRAKGVDKEHLKEGLTSEINELAEEIKELYKNIKIQQKLVKDASSAWEKARDNLKGLAMNNREVNDSDFLNKVAQQVAYGNSVDNISNKLTEIRSKLGFLAFSKKKHLDYLLANKGLVDMKAEEENKRNAEKEIENLRESTSLIAEKYKNLIVKTWDQDDDLRAKYDIPKPKRGNHTDLPYDTERRLGNMLEDKVGKLGSIGDDYYLRKELLKKVTEGAGGDNLLYEDPRNK